MAVTILPPIISPTTGIVQQKTDTQPLIMGPELEFAYVDSAGVHRRARVPAKDVAQMSSMADLQAWADEHLDPQLPSWVQQP